VTWLSDLGAKVRAAFGTLPSGFPDEWQLLPPLHINEAGWLEGQGVVKIPSDPSWYYPKLSTPTGDPQALVAHVSATNLGTGVNMAKNRARPRTSTDRPASWHVSVEVDSIVQMARFEVGCWHALGNIKGVGPANRTAVGIELVGWEKGPFPDGQVEQACRLWRALVQSYGIKRTFAMVPHAVIDPVRRSDPGKVWMTNHAQRVLDFAFA
jgi:hypothetical protein